MAMLKKLPLLALAVMALASCNEKVNPELNGNAVTTSGTSGSPTVVPTEYYLKVEATSPLLLNYKLHRTGNNNFAAECKISSTGVALSNDAYNAEALAPTAHDDKQFDITCYYEAEELAMYMNGLKFQVSASPNTCAYVGYSPYSFYDRMPGDSSTTYTKISCDTATTSAIASAYLAGATYTTATDTQAAIDNTGVISCNDYVDSTLTAGERIRDSAVITDEDLCRFDYSKTTAAQGQDEGPNCDIGTVYVNTVSLVTSGATTTHKVTRTKVKCGGKVRNCIKGPILKESALAGMTRGTVIYDTTLDAAFSKDYELEKLATKLRSTSNEIANYRRNVASTGIDFINNYDAAYASIFSTSPNREQFDPNVMEFYSSNRRNESATPIISTANLYTATVRNGYRAMPLAGDPFMGLSLTAGTATINNTGNNIVSYRTSPFYTFFCLDGALEVKGKIRMVVREWDRIFPTDGNLEAISDYIDISPVRNTVSKMDNPLDQEIPSTPGQFSNFNDQTDWDDIIPMERTSGAYAAGVTIWRPYVVAPYTFGFFNPLYFPNGFL